MTSQLKIRCLLKTTAKKFWTRQRGEGKKSHVLRKEKRGECVSLVSVCDRKHDFVSDGECDQQKKKKKKKVRELTDFWISDGEIVSVNENFLFADVVNRASL